MKRKPAAALIILIGIGLLFIINRNIFRYSETWAINRSFVPEVDSKGSDILSPSIVLPPGEYVFTVSGTNNAINNTVLVFENDAQTLSEDFPQNVSQMILHYKISPGNSRKIEFGAYYDQNGFFRIDSFTIDSSFVIRKKSIMSHFIVSVGIVLFALFLISRFSFNEIYKRVFGKIAKSDIEKAFLLILFLTLLSSFPFFYKGEVIGDDTYFHQVRIESIAKNFSNGLFPPRIYLFVLNDYGYANGLFYPDIFLWFPALLRLLGFEISDVWKFYCILLTFCSLVIVYCCVRKISRSHFSGLCAVILYTFSAFRLIDLFFRGAISQVLSMSFFFIIVLGLYFIFSGKTSQWWVLAVGCILVSLSHVLSTVLIALMMCIFLLMRIKQIIHNRRIQIALTKTAGISLLVAGGFWFPLVEQLFAKDVFLTEGRQIIHQGIHLSTLFKNSTSWAMPHQPYLGYPLILFPLLFFFCYRKTGKEFRHCINTMIFFIGLSALLSTEIIPWKEIPRINGIIQFPWRFFIITTPLLVIVSSMLIGKMFSRKPRQILPFIFVACFCGSIPTYKTVLETRLVYQEGVHLQNNRIGRGEYLPFGASEAYIYKNADTVNHFGGESVITTHKRNGLGFKFGFKKVDNSETVYEIPLLFYKGYNAELIPFDGSSEPLQIKHGINGLIETYIYECTEGIINVYYAGTLIQKLSFLISILAGIVFSIYLGFVIFGKQIGKTYQGSNKLP